MNKKKLFLSLCYVLVACSYSAEKVKSPQDADSSSLQFIKLSPMKKSKIAEMEQEELKSLREENNRKIEQGHGKIERAKTEISMVEKKIKELDAQLNATISDTERESIIKDRENFAGQLNEWKKHLERCINWMKRLDRDEESYAAESIRINDELKRYIKSRKEIREQKMPQVTKIKSALITKTE